jgi:hypothetical protein
MRNSEETEGGRGLGPFTGRQLATIIVAVIVMLMLPVGAWAVSGSNVFLTDATSGTHAAVNSTGALTVAQASPKNFYVHERFPTGVWSKLATPPAGKALVITSILFDTWAVASPGLGSNIALEMSTTDNSCTSITNTQVADVNPSGVGATTVPFQPGLVVPANRSLCELNGNPGSLNVEVYAYGFLIPAASAPAGANLTLSSLSPNAQQP